MFLFPARLNKEVLNSFMLTLATLLRPWQTHLQNYKIALSVWSYYESLQHHKWERKEKQGNACSFLLEIAVCYFKNLYFLYQRRWCDGYLVCFSYPKASITESFSPSKVASISDFSSGTSYNSSWHSSPAAFYFEEARLEIWGITSLGPEWDTYQSRC